MKAPPAPLEDSAPSASLDHPKAWGSPQAAPRVTTFSSPLQPPGSDGQLGHGDDQHLDLPRQVEALADLEIAAVVAGASHSFAITTDGKLYSWGAGQCGRLGHGDEESVKVPKKVDALERDKIEVRSVAGGAFHSLCLDQNGGVHGWGDGDGASLGLGLDHDQLSPMRYGKSLKVRLP